MPQPRRAPQAPPPSRSRGGAVAAAPVAGVVGAAPGAAAGAAALAAGVQGQVAITQATLDALAAMLAAVALRRRKLVSDQLAVVYPGADITAALTQETRRETIFRRRVEQRVRLAMRLALRSPDPSARTAALQAMLDRERRFSAMHSAASGQRLFAAAEREEVRRLSPTGALWKLGPTKDHCPVCPILDGRWWPWSVLDKLPIPLHGGCLCSLRTFGEAIAGGMLTPDQIPTEAEALRLAAGAIKTYREWQAQAEAKFGHLAEVEEAAAAELAVRVALVERGCDGALLAAAPLSADLRPAESAVLAEAQKSSNPHDTSTMAMVALFPPADRAKDLALRGGEKPDQLHVTLAFLGEIEGLDEAKAMAAVAAWAKSTPPLKGKLSGVGHFDLGKGDTVTYRSVDLPDLPGPREKLVQTLDKAGTPASKDHGYTPHLSLAYEIRRPPVKQEPISFSAVTLAWGDERHEFKLTGKPSG